MYVNGNAMAKNQQKRGSFFKKEKKKKKQKHSSEMTNSRCQFSDYFIFKK